MIRVGDLSFLGEIGEKPRVARPNFCSGTRKLVRSKETGEWMWVAAWIRVDIGGHFARQGCYEKDAEGYWTWKPPTPDAKPERIDTCPGVPDEGKQRCGACILQQREFDREAAEIIKGLKPPEPQKTEGRTFTRQGKPPSQLATELEKFTKGQT